MILIEPREPSFPQKAGIHEHQGLVPWVLDPRLGGGDDENMASLG